MHKRLVALPGRQAAEHRRGGGREMVSISRVEGRVGGAARTPGVATSREGGNTRNFVAIITSCLSSSPTRDDYQCPRWDAGRMRARSSHRSRTSARPHAWVVKRSRSGCSSSGGRGWAPTGPVAPPGRAELRQSRQARLEEVQGPS